MSYQKEFLERYVETYLFGDSDTMKRATAGPDTGGGCGYPLLSITFTGIELLGRLLSGWQKDRAFTFFWKEHLYPKDEVRRAVGAPLYRLVRHGVAHVFAPKGPIVVLKGHPKSHLTQDAQGLIYVDASQLSDDFRAAYERARDTLLTSQKVRENLEKLASEHQKNEPAFAALPKLAGPMGSPDQPGLPTGCTGPAFTSSSPPATLIGIEMLPRP